MRVLLLTLTVLMSASHPAGAGTLLGTPHGQGHHSRDSPGWVVPLLPSDRPRQPARPHREHRDDRHRRNRKKRDHRKHDDWWDDGRDGIYVPPTVYVVPDEQPDPPAETVPAAKPDLTEPAAIPLDPAGSAGRYHARGAATGKVWELDRQLPPTVPHVKLDPNTYGLPRPPPGQIYVRVRSDVLLIDETTRRVMSVIEK